MPKLKTHRGAKKRFKKTGKGKIRANNSGARHILTKRSRKNKRQKGAFELTNKESNKIKKLVPQYN
ncbi:MAG TPA: 50S ribosomal protein L35 [Spirochaetota bacterium]|nr:50S ribosomal protein L35 [Spirochaetota bacterium]